MEDKEFDFVQAEPPVWEPEPVENSQKKQDAADEKSAETGTGENAAIRFRRASAKKEEPRTWQKNVLLYLHDFVYLLTGIILVFMLCFRVVIVSGTSMNNTLLDGDYLLLLSDVFYRNPQQGDVIVASKDSFDNGAPIVKRVIATGGQWIRIDFEEGVVYVGDSPDELKPLVESYTLTPTNISEGIDLEVPQKVQEGCLFVMGDNRNGSKDSRDPEIGQIDTREVLGRVIFLFFPGDNHGTQKLDFNRIGVVS